VGNKKVYLGDSVYAEFNGYAFILTTKNGYGPSNIIVLEPPIISALKMFEKSVHSKVEEVREQ
jgi:hypothetical protein